MLLILVLRYDINGKTKYRNQCYYAILVLFILIAGLRWRLMVDTPTYIYYFYYIYPSLEKFSFEDFPIGSDPFYVLINSIVKSLGGRFFWVQLIEAAFVNILVFKYIRRHSDYIFTCIFFYAITCYLGYSMETMRASFTFVLCLFANDFILEKKWIKGYFLIMLAMMFHAQSILMLAVPFLFFMRFNKVGVVTLVGSFILAYFIQKGFGDFFEALEFEGHIANKVSSYTESDKFGSQEGNMNFFIVKIFPDFLYSLFCVLYLKRYHPDNKVLKMEPLLFCGVFFLIFQMHIQIAYRFVDYFRVIFVIFFAETFITILKQSHYKLSLSLATFRVFLIFIPFFLLVTYLKILRLYTIYPYTSVIERRIDHNRELKYSTYDKLTPPPNVNEY